MNVFEHPEFDHHEDVIFCHDEITGMTGIIAIHNTNLGPAAGGCRMFPYESTEEALTDVLRLSRGMTYKNAVAGLPLGGGKCVVIADPSRPDKHDLLRSFSKHVQRLGGLFWTAIDVGVGPADADILAENCDYVFARASQYPDGFSASLFTALGGFLGIRAVATHLWGTDDLTGKRIAVQGLGGTGSDLCRQLHEAGAELVVADIREEAVRDMVTKYDAHAVEPDDIYSQEVDILSPCAMGGVLNDTTIAQLKAKAICGLANNQLAEPRHGQALQSMGIAYVPDYVVNVGGMLGASTMIFSKPTREASLQSVMTIYDTVLDLLQSAEAQGLPTSEVADEIARTRVIERAELGEQRWGHSGRTNEGFK